MKKIMATIMGICMLGACCITGCGEEKHTEHVDADKDGICDVCKEPMESTEHTEHVDADKDGKCDVCGEPVSGGQTEDESKVVDNEIQTDSASFEYVFNSLYKKTTFVDAAAGFNNASDITGGRFFVNGKYYNKLTQVGGRQDVKVELYNEKNAMMINVAAGQAFTLPSREVDVDYTIAKYRTQYKFGDSVLTFSAENQNPYSASTEGPWYVYINEWAIRHLVNMKYYENQNLTLLNEDELGFEIRPTGADPNRAYPTVKEGDLKFRPGYEVYRFDIEINDPGETEYPFYNIGIIHEVNEPIKAAFFVLKSKTNQAEVRDAILQSWRIFNPKGIARNYFENKDPVPDPHWNAETKAYFEQFTTQKTKSWGVFSLSMPGDEASLHPGGGTYDLTLEKGKAIQKYIEEKVWGGKKYDVYMTYTHLGTGSRQENVAPHYYPVDMSRALAGGNGFNGKPALEFTFQYTTNNNLVDQELTPMFDIMRGKYDEYFARLAKDIKAYEQPVMFRLNNEMNTDWTSYSGIMNLLDPDIFTSTWIRLYNIFIENGVDNVIWVWNPIAKSSPYSGWGEDLSYFPGFDYVQLLGGTSYEFNNYTGDAMTQYITFKKHYSDLYEKNKPYFEKWSMIIGEFACGSGGDATGELGRNRKAQAAWVRGMFEELNAENPAPYAQQIKGLIWFNCNDYGGSGPAGITNRLRFTDAEIGDRKEDYSDLTETWEAFKTGFANAPKVS